MNRLFWTLLVVQMARVAPEDVIFKPYHVSLKSIISFASTVEDHGYFGYSCTSFADSNTLRIAVSAPRAGVVGQVFKCDIGARACNPFPTPDSLTEKSNNLPPLYKGHHFWLGATVKGRNSTFVACAPLCMQSTKCSVSTGSAQATYGYCFNYDANSGALTELNTISQTDRQEKGRYTSIEECMDSLGWSMDISETNKLLVGGPAMTRGRAMSYKEITPTQTPDLLLHYESLEHREVNFNFGYSVAYGNFLFDKTEQIAVGSPYGNRGVGKVLLFKGKTLQKTELIEPKKGKLRSLFAATLCSAKLNSSRIRAHLLVGAPAFVTDNNGYDRGAVHIYVPADKRANFELRKTIYGTKDGGYFGSSIVNVGDLDGDGSDDVAIAAPFEDSGRGAVYIYLGSDLVRRGGEVSHKQRIQPEGYNAFGLSLSALDDYDSNGCKELIVGAPGSMTAGVDRVALVRCMAWINVKLQNDFSSLEKRKPDDETFVFKSCLNVTYPPKLNTIDAKISVAVKINHPDATLDNSKNKIEFVVPITTKDPFLCKDITVLTPKGGQYDKKIGIKITASQIDSPMDKEDFDPSYVILGGSSVLSIYDNKFVGSCLNETCNPILNATIESQLFKKKSYVIGSTEKEKFSIMVENTGDIAYSACLYVSARGVPISVKPQSCEYKCNGEMGCGRLKCLPQEPVRTNSTWKISDIVLDTSGLNSADKSIGVEVQVHNDCYADSYATVSSEVTLKIEYKFTVMVKSDPSNIIQVKTVEAENRGTYFQHSYDVTNLGPTNLLDVKYVLSIKKMEHYVFAAPTVNEGFSSECKLDDESKTDNHVVTCDIAELRGGNTLTVLVPFQIQPGKLYEDLKENNITLNSTLQIFFGPSNKPVSSGSVSTILTLRVATVPWWIILLAIILGLMMVALLLFILYEAGCLQRQNKAKLKELKREVRRQSVRRSMRVRDSMRSSMRDESSDENKLCQSQYGGEIEIQEIHNENFTGDTDPGRTQVEIHTNSDTKKVEHTEM